jgi:hypothetical protein
MSKNKKSIELALNELADRYRNELQREELDEQRGSRDDTFTEDYSEELEAPCLPVINLASIPTNDWPTLKVSRLSMFADQKWDWRQEGSPMYRDCAFLNWNLSLDTGLPLLADEHEPLVTLMRALLFYSTPQNAVFVNVRSFNSTTIAGKMLVVLARFLARHNLYVDLHGNGTFRGFNDIPPETFHDYYDSLTNINERTWFMRHVRHWTQLSHANLLPPEYQLGYEIFDRESLAKAYKEFDASKKPYQPISLESLSILVSHCFDIIETYAEDILFAYGLFWPTMNEASKKAAPHFNWHTALLQFEQHKTSLWDMKQFIDPCNHMPPRNAMKFRQEITAHPDWEKSSFYRSRTSLYKTPIETVKNIAIELGIELDKSNRAIYYDVVKVRSTVMNMATMLRNACAVIIFLVTGMRRSELANLEVGSYRESVGEPGSHRLRFLVFKTSDASRGEKQDIPIPHIAYKALCCIERLSAPARQVGGSNLLFASATTSFGKPISLNAINGFLRDWCEELGVDQLIHPHQFRKTLAMFLIYQDAGNLPLIKRLFSHKSLKMSLAYITKLPGIAKEVKAALLEQNMELMSELLEAVDKGIIGGSAGLRIKENVKSGKYAAMLNSDGWESLEQYIDSVLEEGVALLHRASLGVICTKTPAVDQAAPCDPPFAPKVKRLHPNVQNCDPFDCKWAVFTETSVLRLVNEIKAHRKWLTHPYAKADQKQFSTRIISKCTTKLFELGFNADGEQLEAASCGRIA